MMSKNLQLKVVSKMLITFPVNQLNELTEEYYDALICFNSFEARCTTIPSQVSKDNFANCLIFTNRDTREQSENNLNIINQLFAGKSQIIELTVSSPISVADKMEETIKSLAKSCELKKVFIDITTFTHETLLILLAIFREKFSDTHVVCGYVNAKEYSYDCEDQKDKWLSRGIGEIRSVLGYSGVLKPSKKNLLMVIVGYEYERAVRIIETVEPDFLSLGYGLASYSTTEKNRGANEHYTQLVKQMATYYDEIQDFQVPCNDPYKAYQAIREQVENIGSDKNIIIVPMNNKISTIGAALVAFEKPEIQICYAPALIYNYSAYSIAGDRCYIFDLTPPQKISEKKPQI